MVVYRNSKLNVLFFLIIHMINTYLLINDTGNKFWFKNNKLHRNNDLPAIEYANGDKEWWKNGKHHRDGDLPAVEFFNGSKEWYKNGKRHRDDDLPAIELIDGKIWYKNDECHRDNNLPAIEWANGNKYWYKNNIRYYPNKQLEFITTKTVITILIIKMGNKWWYTEIQN